MINKNALIKNLLLSLFSIIFFFSVLEITARLFWHDETQKEHIGVILNEGNRKLIHEGILYKTNSLGLRNKEIQREKPERVKRILALGDSFVWGDGLPDEDLITVKIENTLNDYDTQSVEVINAGISGFNTNDEFEQLKRLAPIYSPDLVIVFFFTNDILQGNQEGGKYKNWKQNIKERLRSNSKFIGYLYYLYKSKYASVIGVPQFMLSPEYYNLDDSKAGWVDFKRGVLQMHDYVKKNNIRFLFVMIPTLTTLDKNYPYMELRNKVSAFIKSNDIHLIDLFDMFSQYHPLELWVSMENSHWNGKATTVADNEIVKYIVNAKLLK